MNRMIFAALLLLFFAATQSESAESKLESWYTYWGIGAVSVSHPEELADLLDLLEDFPGVSRAAISMDLLGFYWPLQDRYLLGGVINGFGDRIEVDSDGLNITGVTYGLSLQYFPQRHIGQGFFIRSDVGPALMAVSSDDGTVEETSDWGLGIGGISGCRLVSANYQRYPLDLPSQRQLASGRRRFLEGHKLHSGRIVLGCVSNNARSLQQFPVLFSYRPRRIQIFNDLAA